MAGLALQNMGPSVGPLGRAPELYVAKSIVYGSFMVPALGTILLNHSVSRRRKEAPGKRCFPL